MIEERIEGCSGDCCMAPRDGNPSAADLDDDDEIDCGHDWDMSCPPCKVCGGCPECGDCDCGIDDGEDWIDDEDNERIANFFPSCRACNIDKGCYPLDEWRAVLEQRVEVLRRNYSAFRHAERFGLVAQVATRVVFYFEKVGAQ